MHPNTAIIAFIVLIVLFHAVDFLVHTHNHKNKLSLKALLVSLPYTIALICGITEYIVERIYFPELKCNSTLSTICTIVGATIMILGDGLRKVAMVQNNVGFTHWIANTRKQKHQLVTTGVYSFCRHPGYLGFWWWSVGSQILLANPVCLVLYIITVSVFTYERIRYEESTLLYFFGQSYVDFIRSTGTKMFWAPGLSKDIKKDIKTKEQ